MPNDVWLEAGAAAEAVGVSASGLRRIAPIYEQVHGTLPRKPKSNNRLWTQDAVERLQQARRLVELERFKTILEALTALQRGLEPDEVEITAKNAYSSSDLPTQQALAMLITEVKALRSELAEVRRLQPVEVESKKTTAGKEATDSSQHGLLVRAALWIERLMHQQ